MSHLARAALEPRIAELGEDRALILDGMLGPERAAAMYAEALARLAKGKLRAAGIGSAAVRAPEVRGDFITWIEADDPSFTPALELFEAVREALNSLAYLGTDALEVQLAVYPPGAGYDRHRDVPLGRGLGKRRMTLIYYLHPWQPGDGGELDLHEPDGLRSVAPMRDRLVLFRPHVEHEVRAVARGHRVALSGWLRTD